MNENGVELVGADINDNEYDAAASSKSEEDGEETDFTSDDEFVLIDEKIRTRNENPDLPHTVSILNYVAKSDDVDDEEKCCGKVYLLGTAHFSEESQNDVRQTIKETQPDTVMVELCPSRISILSMDEEKLLEEAKNLNYEKIMTNIKQSGVVQGIMHCMLLSMSAHVTKQLGMAPGGEFRAAFQEFRKVPGCRLNLGDRPIQVTLQRAFGSLSCWQKLRLFGGLLWSHGLKITKEDIEKAKRRDLLEEILREMAGEFPDLSRIFVDERDQYMSHVLYNICQQFYDKRRQNLLAHNKPLTDLEKYPFIVVGIVGMGHVPGISTNWGKQADVSKLMTIPPKPKWPQYFLLGLKGMFLGITCYFAYRGSRKLYSYFYN